ncbi:MAG: radical SAM protein [Candidatus Nitrosocaldaceae archaeon]|nr:MAG: radical SAM protein [Candidatus Nitrosocaldaceae archaeon]
MGYKIVLSGDQLAVSSFRGFSWMGFLGCIPSNYPKIPKNISIMNKLLFPIESDNEGRLKLAPYSLRKIEAALLEYGFDEKDVIVADPNKLDKVIDGQTKVIGLTVHDPLGYSAVSQLIACVFRLIKWNPAPSYTAISFKSLISKMKHNSRLIIGGPGIWQLEEHPEKFDEWHIDCLVEGEAEGIVGKLFEDAINGKKLPFKVRSTPIDVNNIPIIRNPASTGVEITRGCGRGCQFCSPDLLMFRSIPKERVLKEVALQVKHGIRSITLHSEDALFYGRKLGSFEVNHDAIIDLFSSVKRFPGVKNVGTDFFACSTVKSSPRTIKALSEIMELDKKHPGFVETGLETVSPKLVKMIMPGKVKPYTIEEWPDVIDDALGLLDDNNWFTVASLMTGLPKESEKDVLINIEFVDRIKDHNVFIWVFPLMPLRAMRKQAARWMPEYTPLRQELIINATKHSIDMINKNSDKILGALPSHVRSITKLFLRYVCHFTLRYLKDAEEHIKYEDRLNLYKDLAVNNEGEAVMHAASVVNELINLRND